MNNITFKKFLIILSKLFLFNYYLENLYIYNEVLVK